MEKLEYIRAVNKFNKVSGFRIILREDYNPYDDLLSYTTIINLCTEKAEYYEKMLRRGYIKEKLGEFLMEIVIQINKITLGSYNKIFYAKFNLRRYSI